MGLYISKMIKNIITSGIELESDGRSFLTCDGYKIYGKILTNYDKLPDNLPEINGLRYCTEDDILDFMNNFNRITFINNKHLVKYIPYRYCDICREYTFDDFYHNNSWYDPEHSDIIYDYNICISCFHNYKDFIDKNDSYLVGYDNLGLDNYFGWIPVYRDTEFNGLLYNCNPLSKNYEKYAVWVCDENEKVGINILQENIEEIKEELEHYYIKWNENIQENNEEHYYNAPLFNMVKNRDLEYYF